MSNLVIVAIPAKDDAVWKVSTEKVPHLTLLFLGEMQDDDGDLAEDTQRIVDFVGHAVDVAEHGQFMMDVDYRDNLGPDDADVLFFKKNGWSSKWITQFRGQLLQQTDIKTAYDSSPQYEEWTPHLTLGYPTAPAKDDAIEHPISWISFDRIAVWTGDYEGPEFRLQWPERDGDLSVAYSDTGEAVIADILAHHGVKGMKWGVRKEEVSGGGHIRVGKRFAAPSNRSQAALVLAGPLAFASPRLRRELKAARAYNKGLKQEKKAAKLDQKWEKQIYTTDGAVRLHNAMADHFNSRIDAINNKSEYKDLNLNTHPTSELSNKYMKEVDGLTHEGYRHAVQTVYGTSPSGKRRAQYDEATQSVKLVDASVAHAATKKPKETIQFRIRHADSGHVLEMNKAELADPEDLADGGVDEATEMTQSVKIGEQFVLEHYGVLGMKWGRRKEESSGPPAPVAPHATSRVPQGNKRKTQIETSGGENHPAHEDAIKVAKAQAKLKKSGLAALSNRELQDVATRVQLEKQVSLLTGHKGKQFVQKHLRTSGDELTRQTIRTGIKRAGIAAVLA